jgi:hypothetical protein
MDDMKSIAEGVVLNNVISLLLARIAQTDPNWVKSEHRLLRLNYRNAAATHRDLPAEAAATMSAAMVSKLDDLFGVALQAISEQRGQD